MAEFLELRYKSKGHRRDRTYIRCGELSVGLQLQCRLFVYANVHRGGIPAYWLSDVYGRSILLAAGLPNMAWSMLVFAFMFKIPEGNPARVPLVIIWAIIFTLFYAPTAGTSPFSISAEVYPLVSREAGMAVSVGVNLLGAGILVGGFSLLPPPIWANGGGSVFSNIAPHHPNPFFSASFLKPARPK